MYYLQTSTQQSIAIYSFILLFCVGCKTKNFNRDTINSIPRDLHEYYAIDMINTEQVALQLAEIILKDRNPNIEINKFKPFNIKLIADSKVWEISTSNYPYGEGGYVIIYNLRINKNTGEIVNYWVDK